jgi:hypothetical protein
MGDFFEICLQVLLVTIGSMPSAGNLPAITKQKLQSPLLSR